jgi:hypothetical protein
MIVKGIMRAVQRLVFASMLAIIVPTVFAQAPPANRSDDLDVTMRVIVDPNAKVPDEIVRRIQLPKPAQPVTPSNKPAEPGAQGKERASEAREQAREQGREFGQQVSEEAKRRAEEARRNKPPPPGTPGTPGPPGNPGPPRNPPGRPNPPPPGG